jgi:hypothetical protein
METAEANEQALRGFLAEVETRWKRLEASP